MRFRQPGSVVKEIVGIECAVSEKLECAAMQLARPPLRDGVDYIAHASAILSSEDILLNPELLRLVNRRGIHDGIPGAVPVPMAVEQEACIAKPRASKGECRCILVCSGS